LNLQILLVAVAALVAVGYLARQAWRTWAGGCSGGCCKKTAPGQQAKPLIAADELLGRVRQRAGEKRSS
jgi:hypothetical protein